MSKSKARLVLADELAVNHPAYRAFLSGISNINTKGDYTLNLEKFMAFHEFGENFEKVIKYNAKEISQLITDYLDYCRKRGVKNTTLRSYLSGIELFFIMNDCIWHKDRVRRTLSQDDEIPGGQVPVTTDELYQMLQHTKSGRTICMVHFLADTGMRPAGMTDPIIRIKHLFEMWTPDGLKCYALKIYDGSKSGYWAFLTPETVELLDSYFESRKSKGENLNDESAIFPYDEKRRNKAHEAMTTDFARVTINNLIVQAGIKRTKVSKYRYDKSVMYMFRKRFNTILKINNEVNSNIAEKLMAHKRGLDGTYLQPTREECFAEFVKAIPELTIDPTHRQKLIISKQDSKIAELNKKNKKIEELEESVKKLQEEKNFFEDKRDMESTPASDVNPVLLGVIEEMLIKNGQEDLLKKLKIAKQ